MLNQDLNFTVEGVESGGHTSKLCRVARDKYRNAPPETAGPRQPWKTSHKVNTLTDQQNIKKEDYVWVVGKPHECVVLPINEVPSKFIIDSGATVNLLDEQTFSQLGYEKNSVKLERPMSRIYPYGSKDPLQVIGVLCTKIKLNDKVYNVNFHVVKGNSGSLIGHRNWKF
jgi:hypothetical protein